MKSNQTVQNLDLIQKKLDKNNQFKDFNKTIGYLIRCVDPSDLEYYDPNQVLITKKHGVYEELIINTDYGKKRFILDKVVNQKLSEISNNLIWINSRYLIKDQEYLNTLIKLNAPDYLTSHQTVEEKRKAKLDQAIKDIIKLLKQRPRIACPKNFRIKYPTSFSDESLTTSQTNFLKSFEKEFPEQYAKLIQLAPHFDAEKMSKRFDQPNSSAKKLDALDWAKNKKNKFSPGKLWGMKGASLDEKICMFIQLSGTTNHNGYDKKFLNELKKIRPEWFNNKGELILETNYQIKKINDEDTTLSEKFNLILISAKNNDFDKLKNELVQPTKVIQSLQLAKHNQRLENFKKELNKVNTYWYNELYHNDVNPPMLRRASELQDRVNKLLKEKEEPSAPNKNSPWSSWIYIKRNAKQGDKRYIHAYNEIIKHKSEWKE